MTYVLAKRSGLAPVSINRRHDHSERVVTPELSEEIS
jgi:hypothetical protein